MEREDATVLETRLRVCPPAFMFLKSKAEQKQVFSTFPLRAKFRREHLTLYLFHRWHRYAWIAQYGKFFSPCTPWMLKLQLDTYIFIAVGQDMSPLCAIEEFKIFFQPNGMKNEATDGTAVQNQIKFSKKQSVSLYKLVGVTTRRRECNSIRPVAFFQTLLLYTIHQTPD